VAKKITPFLWFDNQAEEAAEFYVSVFENSEILSVSRYGEVGPGTPGTAMTVHFRLDGQEFEALNGGPHYTFTEAISFVIDCETQEEVDYYWSKLSEGGRPDQCGWLKDRFGLSWQVVPRALIELLQDPDPERANRVMQAMLQMTKIDIAALEEAHAHA
jgi:predicted 3-demethylubiquinone-9 3-methyltransferase (glyoxalase superfamily)